MSPSQTPTLSRPPPNLTHNENSLSSGWMYFPWNSYLVFKFFQVNVSYFHSFKTETSYGQGLYKLLFLSFTYLPVHLVQNRRIMFAALKCVLIHVYLSVSPVFPTQVWQYQRDSWGFGNRTRLTKDPALPHIGCVTLGNSLSHSSELYFPHL